MHFEPMPPYSLFAFLLISLFVILSFLSKKIDLWGAILGGIIASTLFLGGGFPSLSLLFIFFVAGSWASHWKKKQKTQLNLEEANEGKRTAVNAFSNGGVAGICGFLAWIFPENAALFNMMGAASLASACADTFASEFGNIYGSRYFNILNFRKDQRGLDGVISFEGLLFGAIGSVLISVSYGVGTTFGFVIFWIWFVGNLGNLMDSILGATLQRKDMLNNHSVNFLNTLFAALLMTIFYNWL